MANLKPCKHLDYDEAKYGDACTLRTCAPHYPDVKYWERGEVWTAGGNPRNVPVLRGGARAHKRHFRVLPATWADAVLRAPGGGRWRTGRKLKSSRTRLWRRT